MCNGTIIARKPFYGTGFVLLRESRAGRTIRATRIDDGGQFTEGDARLFAAAPDMLAALQAVIAADDANAAAAIDYRTGHGEFASLRRAAGLARAAIAKGEGLS